MIHASRRYYAIALELAAAPLAVALVSQYGFGTHPCDLCIIQRYPYAVAAMIALLAVMIKPERAVWQRVLWVIIIISFFVTGDVAAYHYGVEQGWVKGPESCSVSGASGATLDELKAQILGAPLVSCSDVGASFAGLSMAGWNALYGNGIAILLGWLVFLRRKPSN